MKQHYDESLWRRFVIGDIDEDMKTKMEEHMLTCETCLELYLSIIEEESNESELSEKFTDEVLEKIHLEEIGLINLYADIDSMRPQTEVKNRNKNIFIYYVAAASITLFFMLNGVFQSVTQSTPQVLSQMCKVTINVEDKHSENFINKYSEKISSAINNFVNNKKK